MNTNALSAQAPATGSNSAPAAPGSGTARSNCDSNSDFVLTLAQSLGASNATAAPLANLIEGFAESAAGEPGASIEGGAVLPTLLPIPWSVPGAHGNAAADPLELLGLTGAKSAGADARTLSMLETALGGPPADITDLSVPEGPATTFNSVLEAQQAARTAPSNDSTTSRPLHATVGTSAWAEELSTRMTWMTERGQQTASLKLSPEHLGPLEIRIAIRDDQASVWFGAAHADTRAAIEQALPRLRELFAAQGMSLTDAGVFREPPRDQQRPSTAFAGAPEGFLNETTIALPAAGRLGLIDAYA